MLFQNLLSGISARKGGLSSVSTAFEAGLPEVILWMQIGPAQDATARRYVQLESPNLLYSTWRAFDLWRGSEFVGFSVMSSSQSTPFSFSIFKKNVKDQQNLKPCAVLIVSTKQNKLIDK